LETVVLPLYEPPILNPSFFGRGYILFGFFVAGVLAAMLAEFGKLQSVF
jgi:hypothetical protein